MCVCLHAYMGTCSCVYKGMETRMSNLSSVPKERSLLCAFTRFPAGTSGLESGYSGWSVTPRDPQSFPLQCWDFKCVPLPPACI